MPHLACEIVSGQTTVRRHIHQGIGSSNQATGMVLVEAAMQQQAEAVCAAMVDDLLPRLWALINDSEAALTALRAWIPPPAVDLQSAVIAIRWPHCLLYTDGRHRLAVVRKHRVRIIASNRYRPLVIHVEELRIDDRVVMMSESTSEALPIPAIGLAAQKGPTPGMLARDLVQAATDLDPYGAHAVLSLLAGAAA